MKPVTILVKAERARASLRRLASNLGAIAVSKTHAAPERDTARELAHGLRAAADLLVKAEADAIAARDRAYARKARPASRAPGHPWDARAVVPKRPQGVQ